MDPIIQREDHWGPQQACAGAAFSPSHGFTGQSETVKGSNGSNAGDFLETLAVQRLYPHRI